MGMRLALRRLAPALFRWLAVGAGFLVMLRVAVAAFGGKAQLWAFQAMPQSRFTSMAILTGTFRLRNGLQHATFDEQIHDGAVYTNWGFGVPFLQLPFHALAHRLPSKFPAGFFPDRAIYFVYFAALLALLWAAFDRLLARRGVGGPSPLRRHFVSGAAALFTASCALFPLMSCRFIVYEETICYFELFELAALAAYVFALETWPPAAVCAVGFAAGMGLLIRPTGLLYVGVWGFMVAAASRRRSSVALFVAGLAPVLAVWMWTNHVRSGSLFDFGIENSTPGYPYHTPMVRFGSVCADTRPHMIESAKHLFRGLFVQQPTQVSEWMTKCHFDLEMRGPDTAPYMRDAFLGPVVLVVLVWILLTHLFRGERRLSVYAPLAAIAALFGAYTLAGGGFAWRYAGDLWPLIVLACVEYVRVLPTAANPWLGTRLAIVLACATTLSYQRQVPPALTTLQTVDPAGVSRMWRDFEDARYQMDPPLPPKVSCADFPGWPLHNALGWTLGATRCQVGTFTNVYLGLPRTASKRRTIRFDVDHASPAPLRVYANGRLYKTHTEGDAYVVDVELDSSKFFSPIVQVTIEWVPVTGSAPPIHLRSVELS